MIVVLHFEAAFEAVYSINGVFVEDAQNIRYQEDAALYVTVYPLRAMQLPYTVKMIGGRVVSNQELCSSYRLPGGQFVVKLRPRSNYVYSPTVHAPMVDVLGGLVHRFFLSIHQGDIAKARLMMTEALNGTVTDADIADFFVGFVDIVPNKFEGDAKPNSYYFVGNDGKCELFDFVVEDGLIDNIISR